MGLYKETNVFTGDKRVYTRRQMHMPYTLHLICTVGALKDSRPVDLAVEACRSSYWLYACSTLGLFAVATCTYYSVLDSDYACLLSSVCLKFLLAPAFWLRFLSTPSAFS